MSKNPSSIPRKPWGELAEEIDLYFGNYSNFVEEFNKAAKGLFGSGYVWLSRQLVARTAENAPLVITTTVNQDSPVSEKMLPILVLDVWEHAYYLKHQYKRADYIADWWAVVDWGAVHQLDLWWKAGALVAKDEL